jgi:hypothetical protein
MAPNEGPGLDAFGQWSKVAGVLIAIGRLVPGAAGLADILDALVKAQAPDADVLKAINAVRNSPFKQAMDYLKDATRVGRNNDNWERWIRGAEEKLREARAMLDSDDWQGYMQVEFNLAVVYLALGEAGEAQYRLGECTDHAKSALATYLQAPWWDYLRMRDVTSNYEDWRLVEDHRAGATPNIQPKWVHDIKQFAYLATFFAVMPTVLGGYGLDAYRKRREARLLGDLENFLGLYNLNEYVAAAVLGRRPNYVSLIDKSGAGQMKYWLIDDPKPLLPQLPSL